MKRSTLSALLFLSIAGAAATPERLALSRALYERACRVLSGCHELAA